jgi:hypothetical protein
MTQRLEPLTDEELGEYRDKVGGRKVYGLIRRADIDENVLASMKISKEAQMLRLRKSRRWILPNGLPQLSWLFEVIFDFGQYKSEWNGKHDLDGGDQCQICHTWHRYGHLLRHSEWPTPILVGSTCATMFGDTDPAWLESKLALLVQERQARLLREELEQRLAREENLRQRVLTEIRAQRQYELIPFVNPTAQKTDVKPTLRVIAYVPDHVTFAEIQDHVVNLLESKWQQNEHGNHSVFAKIYGFQIQSTVFWRREGWKYVIHFHANSTPIFSSSIYESSIEACYQVARMIARLLHRQRIHVA